MLKKDRTQIPIFSFDKFSQALREKGLNVPKFVEMTKFKKGQIYSWRERTMPSDQEVLYLTLFFEKPREFFFVNEVVSGKRKWKDRCRSKYHTARPKK